MFDFCQNKNVFGYLYRRWVGVQSIRKASTVKNRRGFRSASIVSMEGKPEKIINITRRIKHALCVNLRWYKCSSV
jgi:hypothetical protein